MGLAVRNTLTSEEVVAGGNPITGGDQSAIYITDIELNYEVVGTGPSLTSDVYQSHIVLPGNVTTNSSLIVDLLGGNAREALLSYLGTGDSVTVLVRMKLLGKFVSGGKTESNEISYPIQFFRSGFTCPTGTTLLSTGPCGGPGGQDSYAPSCTDPDDA
ncbi:putative lipoprotein [Myxococcus hansupus]|uniref:Putative lipoprotein n=1 Tax=Pseudomyxococcus hansupus TaxID=1297742 RepID=A0A0H4WLG5_9BACT|nr:putative lipoprotein [Myxococcus hansupus]